MSKIFISYRRQDSRDVTGRIYDRLLRHFEAERIFKDVDNIAPGEDYRDAIDREIGACSVLLAIIGPTWLKAKKGDGKLRLDDPHDMVRIELETALRREKRVIPILVTDARMPDSDELPDTLKELADRNALAVRHDPDFHRDMDRLVELMERAMTSNAPVLAELIDPNWANAVVPPPVQPAHFDGPHAVSRPAGFEASPHYGQAEVSPFASPSGSYPRPGSASPEGMITPAAVVLGTICLLGLAFCSLMLIGAFASYSDPEGVDKEMDLVLGAACAVGWLGDLIGLAAAAGMFFRKLYWPVVLGVCAMALCTLVFCPVLNLPGAAFALYVLFRPGVRGVFEEKTGGAVIA
ncbi:MAG TPA: toll/interleukin-1 receptor domain-containing protein [Pirellulaceae bacterium]|nr:toll/interleukin-1 receptor domain-containing protein [Pirellulaceae bacterium]